jgi:hypothetical protein
VGIERLPKRLLLVKAVVVSVIDGASSDSTSSNSEVRPISIQIAVNRLWLDCVVYQGRLLVL